MADNGPDPRVAAVADSIDRAETMSLQTSGGPPAPPETKGRDPVELDPDTGLPSDCQVTPLGKNKNTIYLLTAMQEVMALNGRDRSRNTIPAVFAPDVRAPFRWWPRLKEVKTRDEDGYETVKYRITGIKAEDLWDDMVAACARQGIWDPTNTERGTGGWALASGELVFHCGDRLYGRGKTYKLGVVGRHVYAGARRIQTPWPEPVGVEAGLQLLDEFESWSWTRGQPADPIDALLLLGWHVASRMGGALKWRPMAFVIGGAGTGKSTLHGVLKLLHAEEGIIYTTDTTAAALANLIGYSSRPVVVDEVENSADNSRARAVMDLARLAASGAPRTRSNAEQGVTVTVARNAMLFDAINPPEMTAATRGRFVMLRLGRLAPDAAPRTDDPVYWDELGRKIMRRILDQWDRWDAVLGSFHERLSQDAHLKRSADQYATLLAAAHLALSNHLPNAAELDRWAARLAPDELIDLADAGDDAVNCIDHLVKAMPAERFRGVLKSTAQLCRSVMIETNDEFVANAENALALAGLKMYRAPQDHADGRPQWLLGVANSHPGLTHIFAGTAWHTSPGVTPGGWVESLRRLDGAENANRRINGVQTRMVLIPARQHVVDPWDGD